MPDRKLVDEVHRISRRRGNGQLRREVWISEDCKVSRYNLAYINHALCAVDNGRVVGYDNQHGYHHRHYFGAVYPVDFVSFEEIEAAFEAEWMALGR
ncbi:MAG: DUF6516 family protein [Acidithiobacillus sp.]|jgi:hypothetical protein|nr:DUF6516 family protein [Acidithiobacillus sp.]